MAESRLTNSKLACALLAVFACVMAAVLALVPRAALADDVLIPDLTRTGSISVDVISTDTHKAIPGGSLTLYQVATAAAVDTGMTFILTDDFSAVGIDPMTVGDDARVREMAQAFADYAASKGIKGTSLAVGANGNATFTNLDLGLYLIVQPKAADGYDPLSAFLVTVPLKQDGKLLYDVVASPKPGTANTTPVPPTPTPTPPSGKLPQTGQLWWPVPWLALSGAALLAIGLISRHRDRPSSAA